MQRNDPLELEFADLLRVSNDRLTVLGRSSNQFAMESTAGRESFPEEVKGTWHRLGVGEIVNKVANDEGFRGLVVERHIAQSGTAEWTVKKDIWVSI